MPPRDNVVLTKRIILNDPSKEQPEDFIEVIIVHDSGSIEIGYYNSWTDIWTVDCVQGQVEIVVTENDWWWYYPPVTKKDLDLYFIPKPK